MILYCRGCGRIWSYRGGKADDEPGTSCSRCKGYVPFSNRVDQPLPDGGEYGGAEYIGVTAEGDPVYYDTHWGLMVTFIGRPNPYTENREEKEENLLEYMKDVAWKIGWNYRISDIEIKKLRSKSYP